MVSRIFLAITLLATVLTACSNGEYEHTSLRTNSSQEQEQQSQENAGKQNSIISRKYLYTVNAQISEKVPNVVHVFEDLVTGNLIYHRSGYGEPSIDVITPTKDQVKRLQRFGYREVQTDVEK